MGFNYLQTDDRDDYLSRFGHNRNRKRPESFTLKDPAGNVILDQVPSFQIRNYLKRTYLKPGQSPKHIWRKALEEKGYQIINNY